MIILYRINIDNYIIFQEENLEAAFEDSDEELEHRTRDHPIDESHRVTLRFHTEKHINPRTGEVIDGVKHAPPERNPLSYDVQNIEAVAPANVVRRYGMQEEHSTHSSTKDSAYGSMEAKVNKPAKSTHKAENKQVSSLDSNQNNSPSRSLSATSINQNRSPLSPHAQRFQRSEEVFSKELESLKGSSSTLHSLGNSSRSNSLQVTPKDSFDTPSVTSTQTPPKAESVNTSRPHNPVVTQNGFSPGSTKTLQPSNQGYVSMKNTVYDNKNTRTENNVSSESTLQKNPTPDSPYTSMMNIVQGQMKINPHATETNRNTINVSVAAVKRKK